MSIANKIETFIVDGLTGELKKAQLEAIAQEVALLERQLEESKKESLNLLKKNIALLEEERILKNALTAANKELESIKQEPRYVDLGNFFIKILVDGYIIRKPFCLRCKHELLLDAETHPYLYFCSGRCGIIVHNTNEVDHLISDYVIQNSVS